MLLFYLHFTSFEHWQKLGERLLHALYIVVHHKVLVTW
jgi:hypothetical protein